LSDLPGERGVTGDPPVVFGGLVQWYKQKAAFLP
jgi:hypothetical protein